MKKILRCSILVLLGCCLIWTGALAQQKMTYPPKGWQLLDWGKDSLAGISLQQAYDFLKAKGYKSNPVIVGVIDTGIDTTHEDLKNVLWRNSGEIPGNGKDDDGNGYIDDVYGWNFLGNINGENLKKDLATHERVYYQYRKKWQDFDSTKITSLAKADLFEYKQWKMAEKAFYAPPIQGSLAANSGYLAKMYSTPPMPFFYRDKVIKDNYYDFNDRYYGNGDVMARDALHGTHVAGIIAAERNNNLGMDGVADHARIMFIRSVSTEGGGYDKDLALAIRYAVDNGARVINFSSGGSFSTERKWLDDAIRYAEEHDVLFIKAAGNSGRNIDEQDEFPSAVALDGHVATNFITVGSSDRFFDVTSFSCYGKKTVNVFAPGDKIYSTITRKNQYSFLDGTSMAAPVVSGIAAVIREYFPDLSARQVKYVIEHSVVKPPGQVLKPTPNAVPHEFKNIKLGAASPQEKVWLGDLCTSGGVVNAFEAVKLASTLKGELKKKEVTKILEVQKK